MARKRCRVGAVGRPRGLRGQAALAGHVEQATWAQRRCVPLGRVGAASAACRSVRAGRVGRNRGFYLMSCIKDVPTLRGDNYTEWRKKVDFAFVCAEVDWVVDTPQPAKPTDPVRADEDTDDAWAKKKRDHAPVEMS
ncbi:hypothetical protein QYE76_010420 [Lolium multiflorum]|uniref:Gag-pol polyprotein n=1 Tax=Lolium multiflorum TaxID=4521 RepID=A0AAD8X1V2_LOLMU|nr:hypothetical protein QYE76_010420 [Lolium multiflorum]